MGLCLWRIVQESGVVAHLGCGHLVAGHAVHYERFAVRLIVEMLQVRGRRGDPGLVGVRAHEDRNGLVCSWDFVFDLAITQAAHTERADRAVGRKCELAPLIREYGGSRSTRPTGHFGQGNHCLCNGRTIQIGNAPLGGSERRATQCPGDDQCDPPYSRVCDMQQHGSPSVAASPAIVPPLTSLS